jgi:hypothetical protein
MVIGTVEAVFPVFPDLPGPLQAPFEQSDPHVSYVFVLLRGRAPFPSTKPIVP